MIQSCQVASSDAQHKQLESVLTRMHKNIRFDRGSSDVHDFETKLSSLYNTLATLDNGTVIQINTAGNMSIRVVLQGVILVRECDKRAETVVEKASQANSE